MPLVAQVFPLNADGAASGEAQSRLIRTLARLPEQWTLLRDRRIENEAVDGVLIHPELGVALVNLAPRSAEGAVDALGHRLERERFAAYFPGALPLVSLAVPPEAISEVGEHLAEAFEAAPRLDVADRDWVDALIEMLLQPEDFAMAPVEAPHPFADAAEPEPALTAESALFAALAAPPAHDRGRPEPALPQETAELYEPEPPEEPPVVISDPIPSGAEAPAARRRDGAEIPPRAPLPAPLLVADEHIALARPRRHGEHWLVAAAIATGALLGLFLLDWQQQPPPTRVAAGESTVPLPTPAASDTAATPPAEASSPPPVPPGPVTMLAAKPLVTPPLLRHATAVAPLPSPPPPPIAAASPPAVAAPPVAAAPPPAATTPPVAAAPAPAPPVAEAAPPIPPVAAAPPPPPERPAETPATTKAPPRETASLTPASRVKHKPRPHGTHARPSEDSDDEAPTGNTASTDPSTSRAPPVDAADLPPLENAPTAALTPPAPPASAAAAGAPIPLVPRQPPERLSGSSAPTARECRPYTGTTTLSGREAPVQGMACRDSDGQWHLVSETTPR